MDQRVNFRKHGKWYVDEELPLQYTVLVHANIQPPEREVVLHPQKRWPHPGISATQTCACAM